MLFTFKRDDEGHERIYVGDVCVVQSGRDSINGKLIWRPMRDGRMMGVAFHEAATDQNLLAAIDRADEAGFWDKHDDWYRRHEVTVDVPVADNAVLTVKAEEG